MSLTTKYEKINSNNIKRWLENDTLTSEEIDFIDE